MPKHAPIAHRVALVAAALMLWLVATATAAEPKAKDGKAAGAPPSADKPFAEWSKTTKDATRVPGFIPLWKKRDNLYAEIAADRMNKPFLSIVSFARGIGSNYTLGGLPLDDRMLEFQRSGDRVLLVECNTRFVAPAGSPIDKARDLSVGNSVIASFKIESEQDSTKTVLVDLASVLVSDMTDLGARLQGALGNVSVRFDKERSALGKVKNFPENTEVEALLTYTPNDRSRVALETVPDNRYIPITVHYSFSKLPDQPMTPRAADNRVGYFLTAMKDFGRDDKESFWLRYVNRWRLEKKDPAAAVSEPVKPIVYYIDSTVPEKFRPWVKEGVEHWQKAFEAAGFRNAILAKDPPTDDPDWDPEDVRYSSIRWITSHEPSFGAIGPSRVDPRTGEILDADILFEASMFQNYANNYRRFAGPDAMAQSILPQDALASLPPGVGPDQVCMAGDALADAGAMQHVAMLMDGSLPPGAPVPDEYLKPAVVWAVMHEVGHTLGLRHNFRSSTSTPNDRLQDVAWTTEHGLYGSVMEYPTANIDPTRSKQGQWWTTGAGTYDLWAIRYGYTATGAADVDADRAAVRAIADESLQPGHEYSTDEDTYPADAPDPRSNIYDLGSDPLKYAKDRTAYLAGLWRGDRFEERIVGPSGDLTALRRAMDSVLQQYFIAAGMAVKYLGGSYVSRVERAQPGEVDPVRPVPAAQQREALDFLAQRVWAADAFAAPPRLLQRLAPTRWSHWGMGSGVFAGRHDYDFGNRVFASQRVLLSAVLAPALLSRMEEAESRSSDAYRMSEHFDRLTRGLWGEVGGASAAGMRALDGANTRRDVQRAYVDLLADMLTDPSPALPDDATALARLQLQRVDARCARVLAAGATLGDYARAHLLETRARIKRALEAGSEAGSGAPSGPRGGMATPATH